MTKFKADFEQLQGIASEKAFYFMEKFWRSNISNARDPQTQTLAKFFIDYHINLLSKEGMSGIIEYSATAANARALDIIASKGKKKLILSNLVHHPSLTQQCSIRGLKPVIIEARPELNYQVPEDAIREAVNREGLENIAGIIATHGTTQLGHIERIAEYPLVQDLRNESIHLHIDAAFGGVYSHYSSRIHHKVADADTITLDPYKLMGMQGAAILLGEPHVLGKPNISYYHHSPHTRVTTLHAGPLAVWYQTWKDFGDGSITRIADECLINAGQCAWRLKAKGIPLIKDPRLNIVPIELPSINKREALEQELYEKGYTVGRVDISGRDYNKHGIRIVCSPKIPPFGWGDLLAVENYILKFFKDQKILS